MNVEVAKDYEWDAILRERGQQLLYKAESVIVVFVVIVML